MWKEYLNSDGQQFHQYQQNQQSPAILTDHLEHQEGLNSDGYQFHYYQQNE